MSFLSILKKIGTTALGIEHVAAPIVTTFFPAAGPLIHIVDDIVARVQHTIVTAEANNPVGNGQLKEAATIADFQAGLETFNSFLAAAGKHAVYDEALLKQAIANQVAAFNSFAALKASFHIEDLPKEQKAAA